MFRHQLRSDAKNYSDCVLTTPNILVKLRHVCVYCQMWVIAATILREAFAYTNELLKNVQREIEDSIFRCFQHSIESDNSFDRIVVMETRNVCDKSKEDDTSEDEGDEDVIPEKTLFFNVCFKLWINFLLLLKFDFLICFVLFSCELL